MDRELALVDDKASNVLDVITRLRSDLRSIDACRRDASRADACASIRRRELKAQTAAWMLKRRKLMKKTLGERKRAQLRELFDALDADGGGEVEFSEFVTTWQMIGGRDAASMRVARELFAAIDVDGSQSMDFDEFALLMSDLDSRHVLGGGANDDRGALFRQAAAALQTRRAISDFISFWGTASGGAHRC
jgi:hypothetical protein